MARKKTIRTRTARIQSDVSPRHLWLAGLGVAMIAAREGVAAVAGAGQRIARARKQAIAAVGEAQSNVLSTVADLRSQIETGATDIAGQIEARVQPLLAKFKPAKSKRTVRRGRPLGSKNKSKSVRRTARKAPAKRVARRGRR